MHILEERIRAEGIEITKIEINASTKSIEVGENKILTATILPSNATDKKISWESSDESIAMINEEGKSKPVGRNYRVRHIRRSRIENLEELDYHSRWKIMEDKQGKKIILTQKLEIDIIELPKIIGKEKEQDNLLDWLYFLENPKSERVTEKMKENENLKEAVKKLDNLSEDEKMQRIADLRQKAIMDEKAIYEKGLEVGIEKGMKEGIQRGIEKGIEKGIMEGSQKEKIEIAKKMLELKIDKETIAEATGLTEQEIEKILN